MEGAETERIGKSSWRIGWESVKANAVPIVVLWGLAAVTVLAYNFVPGVAAAFEPLKRWQTESGWLAAFLNRVFFCGILPGVFLVTVKSIRPRHPFATVVAQTLWCGVWGIACDWFFRLQSGWFGDGADFTTLLLKTAVDQFVWTVLAIAPANAVFFFWAGRDFSFHRVRNEWPRTFIRRMVFPNLLSNWCVWIPVIFVVYAFPQPLQVQVSGFAAAFWTLVCLQIGKRTALDKGTER